MGFEGVKGIVAPGADADLIALDEAFSVRHVLVRGRTAVQDGAGLRAAFLLRAEKRRAPMTPLRTPAKTRFEPGLPTA